MKNNTHNNIVVNAITMIGDVLICVYLYKAFLSYYGLLNGSNTRITIILLAVTYALFVITGGVILYKRNTKRFQIPLLVARNVAWFAIVGSLLMSYANCLMLPFWGRLLFLVSIIFFSSTYRLCIRGLINIYRSKQKHRHQVVLVGSTINNIDLYKELVGITFLGYRVNGYFDYQPNPDFPSECKYLGTPNQVISYLAANKEVEALYCCLPSKYQDDILNIVHYCVNNLVPFCSVPNVRNYLHHRMYFNMLGDVPYLSFYKEPLSIAGNRMLKRTFDICFSLAFLCTLFPIIFVIVAIITKITMPGPIFFRQQRNGLNDKIFYCLKFRSMKVNADADKVQATKNDPRKTKWGNIMRKTNIDELPQFINVLKGDMSIVGPRPHMLKHTEEYSKLIDKYMVRHFVKPGITGWSQVTGFRGETKELSQMEGRVKGDIWYIEHWSFWLDLYIIYKTIVNAIKGDKEAY